MTADARKQASYAGFDFINTWFMIDGQTRPFLRSEWSTTITNAHQLQLISMNLGASYTLANNINYLSGNICKLGQFMFGFLRRQGALSEQAGD
jgi:hypothetical protein